MKYKHKAIAHNIFGVSIKLKSLFFFFYVKKNYRPVFEIYINIEIEREEEVKKKLYVYNICGMFINAS